LIAETFPRPDASALAVSQALTAKIGTAIERAGGWLGFDAFMRLALYEPGLGYYSGGSTKLGAHGDFTTAPELGDWLAAALAPFLAAQFETLGSARVLELGAGTGQLASDLLDQLSSRGFDAVEYSILEPSADLRHRQQVRLAHRRPAVRWLDELPASEFCGIVLANEVADALPVVRFVRTSDAVLPLGVMRGGDGFELASGPVDARLAAAVAAIEADRGQALPEGYRSEVCLELRPWVEALLSPVATGGLLLIDYGMPQREYYRADRSDGTLICHYRQRAHTDALLWPGLQDISAWVDFSAVAAAARAAGWTLTGFTSQAQFLIESIARDPGLRARQPTPREASALKTMILPGEMGERFKLLWLTRGFDGPSLPGRDFRSWL
jgi:SAM-dependent MidA family methyltransferase